MSWSERRGRGLCPIKVILEDAGMPWFTVTYHFERYGNDGYGVQSHLTLPGAFEDVGAQVGHPVHLPADINPSDHRAEQPDWAGMRPPGLPADSQPLGAWRGSFADPACLVVIWKSSTPLA